MYYIYVCAFCRKASVTFTSWRKHCSQRSWHRRWVASLQNSATCNSTNSSRNWLPSTGMSLTDWRLPHREEPSHGAEWPLLSEDLLKLFSASRKARGTHRDWQAHHRFDWVWTFNGRTWHNLQACCGRACGSQWAWERISSACCLACWAPVAREGNGFLGCFFCWWEVNMLNRLAAGFLYLIKQCLDRSSAYKSPHCIAVVCRMTSELITRNFPVVWHSRCV